MNELRYVGRVVSVVAGICVYGLIWGFVIEYWDEYAETLYDDWCWEKVVGIFFRVWVWGHIIAVIGGLIAWCVWSWM